MACARTVSEFADRILGVRVFDLLVRTLFVISRVAATAVRLEGGVLPGNDFGIVLMAVGAGQVAAMVKWFERRRHVTEVVGQESISVVAAIAFHSRNKVTRVLADCGRAVVAGGTGAKHLSVVYICYRYPRRRHMAVFADFRCQRVLWILARRNRAVVTTDTIASDVRVIEIRR